MWWLLGILALSLLLAPVVVSVVNQGQREQMAQMDFLVQMASLDTPGTEHQD